MTEESFFESSQAKEHSPGKAEECNPDGKAFADLLENIISATSSDGTAAKDLTVRRALGQVSSKLRDQELNVDPVLAALVNAVTPSFSQLTPAERKKMNIAIAQSMFEDDVARFRIERLWRSLRERDDR